MGTECHYFVCDVGNREEVYQQAKAVREKVGDVTILVNNAAVVHGKSLVDSDDHALLKSQHINALGQFWTTKAFLPRMLELQKGHIVCLNSVLALSAIPGAVDYCTSKASSFAFMESLTLGLLDCPGVNATTVLPFHTSTEMFQGMRIRFPNLFPPLKPEMVARRTVEAVQQNQAFLLLPWTMHILVVLKRHTSFWIPTSNRWRDLMFPSSSRMLVFLDGVFFAGRNPACRSAFASLSKHLSTSGAGRNPQVCWELHLYEDFQRTDLRVAGNQDLVGPCQGWDPALVLSQ
ncbi:short-chain dehydrogenase/reductase 3 isoform X1 [Python bivittatus]|uniref:Short-chain dehydrogenase/reductase 3 n=1 Tax=Python bivittatus TaxID=176946 RepID=A0A9F5IL91_PYTBI|nr:short-chain dehydrogenase/reductase 3 isoform X1 [Python bivittatus]